MKIGFIGLGIMGKPMALHLKAAGPEVVGPERVSAAVSFDSASSNLSRMLGPTAGGLLLAGLELSGPGAEGGLWETVGLWSAPPVPGTDGLSNPAGDVDPTGDEELATWDSAALAALLACCTAASTEVPLARALERAAANACPPSPPETPAAARAPAAF